MRDVAPQDPHHWLDRGNVLIGQGRAAEAEAAYRRAITLKEAYPEAHYNLGIALAAQGRAPEAEAAYRRAITLKEAYPPAHYNLGNTLASQGRAAEAEAAYRRAIALSEAYPEAHCNLGNILANQGRAAEAEAAYRRAITLKEAYPRAHYNLGIVLASQGRAAEAEAAYRRAIALSEAYPEAHCNLGNALANQGRAAEAEAAYRRAITLKDAYPEAHYSLGIVLASQGRAAEAEAAYRRAIALKEAYPEAHNNLGAVLATQERAEEAETAYRRSLALREANPAGYTNLGHLLARQGRAMEAETAYRRALALQPDSAEASLGLALTATSVLPHSVRDSMEAITKFDRALDELQAWDRSHPGSLGRAVGYLQPFRLAYRPVDVTAALVRYGKLISAAATDHWRKRFDAGRATGRARRERTRLVIVNGHVLGMHPVWQVELRGLIAHLDRRKFEVIVYHTGAEADAETRWAEAQVDRFVHGVRSTEAWLAEMARDRPEVIMYPEVGMDPATCALAALRLAPLQIAGWGHPVTTGLPTMDLFVSGELLEGPAAEQHYCEELVRLPGTGVCTELKPLQPEPWTGPQRGQDVVRFTLCQQPIKFDPADDVLFTRIAQAIGPCEFWLSSPPTLSWATDRLHARLAAAFRSAGLDPADYLRVSPWLTHHQFAGFLNEMDIYLDCPAFSGYTTAWQAVHRGIPIVTLEGQFLRQRLAAGLLRQIGIIEGIAASADEYVEIAVRWAQECRQVNRLSERRETIRQAAPKADGNRAAVVAFERAVLEHLGRAPRAAWKAIRP